MEGINYGSKCFSPKCMDPNMNYLDLKIPTLFGIKDLGCLDSWIPACNSYLKSSHPHDMKFMRSWACLSCLLVNFSHRGVWTTLSLTSGISKS